HNDDGFWGRVRCELALEAEQWKHERERLARKRARGELDELNLWVPCEQTDQCHACISVCPRDGRPHAFGHERINIQSYALWDQSGSLKKQDSAPVWHAGPAGRTRSRIASWSQSSFASTPSITFPQAAPFSHTPRSPKVTHA